MDNTFAGTITLRQGSIDTQKYDFDIIFFTETFSCDIESYDLSISSLDQIDVYADKYSI